MGAPKADPPKCDVPGCGLLAVACSDGSEVDAQELGRKSIPNINHCERHANWPFSHDAEVFATTDKYQKRT
jgi:hypothetical protein